MNYFWRKLNKEERGFTLVELLVVVVILGILASLAVLALGDRSAEAEKATNEANVRIVASAVQLYVIDGGKPSELTALSKLVPEYLSNSTNLTGVSIAYTAAGASEDNDKVTITSQVKDAANIATMELLFKKE